MFQKIIFFLPILACVLAANDMDQFPTNETALQGVPFKMLVQGFGGLLKAVTDLNGPAYKAVKVNNATIQWLVIPLYRFYTVLSDKSNISRNCKILSFTASSFGATQPTYENVVISCDGLKEYTVAIPPPKG